MGQFQKLRNVTAPNITEESTPEYIPSSNLEETCVPSSNLESSSSETPLESATLPPSSNMFPDIFIDPTFDPPTNEDGWWESDGETTKRIESIFDRLKDK